MHTPYAEDLKLAEHVVGGDREAWEELIRRYRSTLRYAIIRAHSRYNARLDDDALDDLEADLMVRLAARSFRRLQQYAGRCSLRQWLKVVAANFAVDQLRKQRTTLSFSGLLEEGESALAFVDPRPQPDEIIEQQEACRNAARLLALLNAEDRLFVELFYARGLPFAEVAELMGSSLGAVYARKNRIRKRLVQLASEAALS